MSLIATILSLGSGLLAVIVLIAANAAFTEGAASMRENAASTGALIEGASGAPVDCASAAPDRRIAATAAEREQVFITKIRSKQRKERCSQ